MTTAAVQGPMTASQRIKELFDACFTEDELRKTREKTQALIAEVRKNPSPREVKLLAAYDEIRAIRRELENRGSGTASDLNTHVGS